MDRMKRKRNINSKTKKNAAIYQETVVEEYDGRRSSRRRPTRRAASALSLVKISAGYKSEESNSSNNSNNQNNFKVDDEDDDNESDASYNQYQRQEVEDCNDDGYFSSRRSSRRRSKRIQRGYRHVLFDHNTYDKNKSSSIENERSSSGTSACNNSFAKKENVNKKKSARRILDLEHQDTIDKSYKNNNRKDCSNKKIWIVSEKEQNEANSSHSILFSDTSTSIERKSYKSSIQKSSVHLSKKNLLNKPESYDIISSPSRIASTTIVGSKVIAPATVVSPTINKNYDSSVVPSLISSLSHNTTNAIDMNDKKFRNDNNNKNDDISDSLFQTTALVSKEGCSSTSSTFVGDDKSKNKSNINGIGSKMLPTSTVIIPTSLSCDAFGLDDDIKRAFRESLETYSEETKNRQLLLEAEYSLARSEFGSTSNRHKQQQKITNSKILNENKDSSPLPIMANHILDEEAFQNAKKASLAQMNSRNICDSSCLFSSSSSTTSATITGVPTTHATTDNIKTSTTNPAKKSSNKQSSTLSMLPPFSLKNFERLWETALQRLGFSSTEEIESGNFLRDANTEFKKGKSRSTRRRKNENYNYNLQKETSLEIDNNGKQNSDCTSHLQVQTRAMYGRTHFGAMKKIIEMTNLCESDIFLDIGHGIGNACLQAAFTVGCESRGIEVVPQRCMVAKLFTEVLMERLDEVASAERDRRRKIGRLELREGSLADPKHRKFMAEADVVLVNNSHDIFGVRSGDVEGRPTLDTYVAGFFAQLKPGARLVSFSPLLALGRSLSEENDRRRKNDMKESLDASFFTSEIRSLGKDAVSWSYGKEIKVFLYTRVKQSSVRGEAIFLCNNKRCTFGYSNGTAAVNDETGLLHEECVYCGTRRTVKTRR